LCYWYSAWQRERADRQTGYKPVTARAGRLAAGMVLPGEMVKQKAWGEAGA